MYKIYTKLMSVVAVFLKQIRHHRLHRTVCFCHMIYTKHKQNMFYKSTTLYKNCMCIVYIFEYVKQFCTYFVYNLYVQNIDKIVILYTKYVQNSYKN